jgi:hypothetical protein
MPELGSNSYNYGNADYDVRRGAPASFAGPIAGPCLSPMIRRDAVSGRLMQYRPAS